jgi:hypothetical protein
MNRLVHRYGYFCSILVTGVTGTGAVLDSATP